jgi:glycosyltransferase involved in cell wall biosynthesis
VLAGLHHAGLLTEFATTLAFRESSIWMRCLPGSSRRELLRRSYDIPQSFVRTRPWREAARMCAEHGLLPGMAHRKTGWASIDAVYDDLDKTVARRLPRINGLGGVYAYEDGAARSFERAEQLGLKRFYDLPIAYWKVMHRLIEEEVTRLPEWAPTLTGRNDSDEKRARKDDELRRAEVVFCPSGFVADSLPEWARQSKEIVVTPFGSPSVSAKCPRVEATRKGKLRVLFAGSMSQRKGLADLFAAVKRLGRSNLELVVMGSPIVSMDFYRRECPGFIYEPTRPNSDVLQLMRSCDVLALPSIVEGRALVLQEAMSQGLPVLITANTGGEDLVESGKTGFLVPIRSPEMIADRLAWFADHRAKTREMGEAACAKAETYSWTEYGARIASAIRANLSSMPAAAKAAGPQ